MKNRKWTKVGIAFFAIALVVVGLCTALSSKADSEVFKILDPSTLTAATLTEETVYDDFSVMASADASVVIDANAKKGEGDLTFSQRFKLGGTGSAEKRSIHFEAESAGAEVTVYTMSGSSSADRTLGLYSSDGTLINSFTAPGAVTDSIIPAQSFTLTDAGKYYLASPSSGVNVYYVQVKDTTTGEAVVRADWDDVSAPVIESVSVNAEDANVIDVAWKMEIGTDGADKLDVSLMKDDEAVASSSIRTEGTQGTCQLTVPNSGSYIVKAVASRDGVEITKESAAVDLKDYVKPLENVKFLSVRTGKTSNLLVEWSAVAEANSYTLEYKENGAADYKVAAKELIETTYTIDALTVGTKYDLKITAVRNNGDSVYAETTKKVADSEERFSAASVGDSAAGTVTVDDETGNVTFDATAGKIADSEDRFLYYYTTIDPTTENFTLTATFKVLDSANKDNQSGFGILAADSLIPNGSSSRYFNSAGAMFAKYALKTESGTTSRYGVPGGRFVTGYTDNSKVSSSTRVLDNTGAFDWDFKSDYVTATNTNPPKFEDGESYTLTLRKSNTGYHAILNNDTDNQVICYEPEMLEVQDSGVIYVGVCAARKIKIEVSDIKFTTIAKADDEAKQERPIEYTEPYISLDTTTTTSNDKYTASFYSNVLGTLSVKDSDGNVVASDIAVPVTDRVSVPLTLKEGDNKFVAEFTPSDKETQGFESYQELTSYDTIKNEFTISYAKYGTADNAIYVSPDGASDAKGTKSSPLDIHTAVNYAQPGQEIILLGGTYKLSKGVSIGRGNNGTADNYITLMGAEGEDTVFDLSECSGDGLVIKGDYWHVYDIDFINSVNGAKPVWVRGNNNIVEKCNIHNNTTSGLQITGLSTEPKSTWPSNNLILSCESYDNCDATANDADGFAAKLTVGEGNVFRYCISHNNIDDGWDLYAKSTTGSIGAVTIDTCVAYSNGFLSDTSSTVVGEGNGFKLGGENMPGAHVLKNSVAFNNRARGISSNNGPDCKVYNCTTYANSTENISFNTGASTTNYVLENFISYLPKSTDVINLKSQADILDADTYVNGVNTAGVSVAADWFKSLDMTIVPAIAADGSIDMGGLLELTSTVPEGIGAVMSANEKTTVITVGDEITSQDPIITPEPTEKPADSEETASGVVAAIQRLLKAIANFFRKIFGF